MTGLLNILPADGRQDWQKDGNFYNWTFDVMQNPLTSAYLLPFITPTVPHLGTNVMEHLYLRQITIVGKVKTVGTAVEIPKTGFQKVNGALVDYWYFGATVEQGSAVTDLLTTGLYEYYMLDTLGNEWISEPIFIAVQCDPYTMLGDFYPPDVNDDFYYITP